MNFNDIINQIAGTDSTEFEKKEHRRNLLKGFGTKLAVAAVPFAAGSLFANKAYGQSKETIINYLNYLLKLELVKEQLYTETANATDLVPEAFKPQIDQMGMNNKSHISIIQGIITDLGGTPITIAPGKIDTTGGRGSGSGPFYKALTSFEDYLILMQVLSDGGSRMYKGAITEVFSDKTTVGALMSIHSVLARQATFVRFLRSYWIGVDIKPWITGSNSDTTNTAAQRAYAGETPTTQAGIDVVGINGFDITANTATEAFDEPLIMSDGNNIIDRFINYT
ncbi:MAG: ferritin-like domain-containing protein [Chitinophagaceae bacterium]|nr:ferritin-like domain-containing protein [Chitinophagaceae bacterium]MCB9044923.1 ferritin-like domain-containing protein [Chitinophagales bacterium]